MLELQGVSLKEVSRKYWCFFGRLKYKIYGVLRPGGPRFAKLSRLDYESSTIHSNQQQGTLDHNIVPLR